MTKFSKPLLGIGSLEKCGYSGIRNKPVKSLNIGKCEQYTGLFF
jgi:hypothetical protein